MTNRIELQSKKNAVLLCIALAFSFLTVQWVLSLQNGFVFDDYSSLTNARFSTWEELFRLLPQNSYNDRSMGWLLYKLQNQLFGMNAQAYHFVYVAIHLANVLLVYCVTKKVACRFSMGEADWVGFFSALFFGAYPVSLMAVSWISATFEMQCCNFILLSLLFYLKAEENRRYMAFYAVCAFLSYWLSLRSKEMSLAFPVILVLYETGKAWRQKDKWKLPWYLWAELLFMIFYAYLLFTGGQGDFSQTNPYHQNFNPLSMMRNAVHYLALYFDPFNPDMSYTMFKMTAIPGLLLFVCCVGAAFWLALKKRRWYALISLVAAAGALVVVLPMENMQHRLYLYIPSIFMALFFAFLIIELQRCSKKQIAGACAVLCCTLCYSLNSAPGVVTLRNYWLSVCGSDAAQMAQLKKLDAPARYAEIYVKGAQNDYNVFYYGPGNVLRLLYDDATLHTTLVDEFPEDVQTPYLFLEYNDGEITEVERDDTPRPQVYIEDVYPNMIDLSSQTGDLVLAVTGSIDWSDLEIRVNDEAVPFVAGEEFCSFTIPRQYLKKGETLRITLYSELACGESEAVEVPIQ